MNILLSFLALTSPLAADLIPKVKYDLVAPDVYRSMDLDGLSVSASGQFSARGFEEIDSQEKKLIVVDLRREFHGFVDGNPISWKTPEGNYLYNQGLSADEIEQGEKALLEPLGGLTEKDFVEASGATYIRFPIEDYSYPTGPDLVRLVQSFPPDSHVHFHCAGGEGRTTTVLAMIEILKGNGSLEEILKRQEDLGGANLYDPWSRYADQPDRLEGGIQRLEFLKDFYEKFNGASSQYP
ncbi:MAG: hypothetical protein JSS32_05195 [Verrucomicrobia bacterium]|nr:hypothetical protein [Verrucomicrobiota bacterium]